MFAFHRWRSSATTRRCSGELSFSHSLSFIKKNNTCWSIHACTVMLEHSCLHGYVGAFMPARLCWSIHACTVMLEHSCLHGYVGAFMPARLCWSIHACTVMLEHSCLHGYVGAFMPARLCWSIHACMVMLEHSCLHGYVVAFMPARLCSSSQHQFYDMRQLLCNMYNNSLIMKYVERQDVLVKLMPVLQNGLIYERSFIYDVVCSVEKSS